LESSGRSFYRSNHLTHVFALFENNMPNLVFLARMSRQDRQAAKSTKEKLGYLKGCIMAFFQAWPSGKKTGERPVIRELQSDSRPILLGALGSLAFLARAFWLRPQHAMRLFGACPACQNSYVTPA
jgi:hypothetical protein